MNRTTRAFVLGLIIALVGGFVVLRYHNDNVVYASRIVVQDGDLFLTSDTLGSKRLTSNKDVKSLFGETNDFLLVGKGYEPLSAAQSQSFGTHLFLYRNDGSQLRLISDRLAEYAFFDRQGKNIIYLTPDGQIYQQDIGSGHEKKVADKASIPSISPDGRYLAYKKMPGEWVPGGYSDGSPGIVLKDIESGNERIIANQPSDHAAFWTPDGQYLYFFGDNGYGMDSLFLIKSNGKDRTLLTNIDMKTYVPGKVVPSISEPPIISNDGSYVIYESDREVWMVHVDLKQKKVVDAKRIGYGVSPAWIEDGKTLSIIFGGNGKRGDRAFITVDVEGNIIN